MELVPATVLATAIEGLLVVDRAGRFTYANPAAEKILGRPAAELRACSMRALKASDSEGEPIAVDELPALRVMRTGERSVRAEHRVERPDGSSAVVCHTATLIRNRSGGVEGAIASLLDITEQRCGFGAPRRPELTFRAFVERSADGVALHRDGKIVYANPALCRMLGHDLRAFVGRSVLEFVHADDRPAVIERIRTVCNEDREVPVLEERLVHGDGHLVEVEASSTPIGYEGQPTVLSMIVDVSERKRILRELDHSVSLLRATLEATTEGILVVDCDGRIATYNERFVEMWRIPAAIIKGRDDERVIAFVLDQLVEPEAFVARMRELYADPNAESFDRFDLTDGRCYERHSLPQRIDGHTVGRVWSFRDVTARKNAENERERLIGELADLAAVAQQHAGELASVQSSMIDGVVVCDAKGVITYVNEAEGRLSGLDHAALLGVSLEQYAARVDRHRMTGEPMGAAELAIGRALAGETLANAGSWSTRTGRKVYLRSNAAPVRNAEGGIAGAVAVERDVSDIIELDTMRDQFIRVAAHELKTPVAIMKGYAEMLLRSSADLPEPLRGGAQAIDRGAKRIDRLVGDLLGVSQLLMGCLELRRERVELAELVDVVVRQVATTAAGHQIRIETEPVVVFADRMRLTQVVDTLLDNAVRYSPRGGDIEVSVTAGENEAIVRVRDHGVGIPRAKQKRIFERFYRAHTDTPHDYGGMGVGLYIAREVVNQHGGKMWFESEEGSGSEFCFSLPV